jgi:pimeloyl-ACP methyl ester carboxylesterase
MKLNFRKLGTGSPIFILHGVFGSADNWQSFGKELAHTNTVYLIDQRNHGLSPHHDQFDYEVMASDLAELMDEESLDKVHVLGHSMGGKVAMKFSTLHPEKLGKLIVVDIAPRYYPPHHQKIFEGFRAVILKETASRKDAEDQMKNVIGSPMIRQFLLKNLTRDDNNTFIWKHNLDVIEQQIENIGKGLERQEIFEGPTLFVGGKNSVYILQEDHETIRHHFPKSSIEMIDGAGHWVHAEKPAELLEVVRDFLA